MTTSRPTFWSDFRQFFLRGLGIVLPSVITLAILWWAFGFLRGNIAEPINTLVRFAVREATPLVVSERSGPEWNRVTDEQLRAFQDERVRRAEPRLSDGAAKSVIRAKRLRDLWQDRWYLQAIGFVVAIVLVYLAGVVMGNFLGKRLWARAEKALTRVPIFKQVYPSVKQVVEFALGGGPKSLPTGKVVLIEFPRPGLHMVGLQTGPALPEVEARMGRPCVTVFVATTPTPLTGFTVTVPKDHAYELDMTFDEAVRYLVSGGVLSPRGGAASALPAPPGTAS